MVADILTALLVVAVIGVVAGVLLAVASHFFAVEENETVKKVREALPGANCGACGYAGCDSYAEAVANGKAEPNLCIPGSTAVAQQLSEILGVSVETEEPKVAFVTCNGNCDATSNKAIYDGLDGCNSSKMLYGGPATCVFGCIGCGDCAEACPVDAICVYGTLAHIDPRVCIGCGKCAKTCAKGIIKMIPRSAKTVVMCSNSEKGAVARKNCKNACIGCKKCQLNCPEKAIKVENNFAVVDQDKCNGCGLCVENCPTKCIKTVDFPNGRIG